MSEILDLIKQQTWVNPVEENYSSNAEYLQAIADSDASIEFLITVYSKLFDPNKYGDCFNYLVSLAVTHVLYLADDQCLRVSTAIKQLESGKNLSLDNVLVKACGCDDDFWGRSIYGKQMLALKNQFKGLGMFVIGS